MWLGSALFFSAVLAPSVFIVLRGFNLSNSSEIAGNIVSRSLSVVNLSGFFISLLLLLTAAVVKNRQHSIVFVVQLISLSVVAATTAVGHWVIAARMHALRVSMGLPIEMISPIDSRRLAFNSLHSYSVTALSVAMIATITALIALGRRVRGLR